jgi:hypothetical protein
MTIYYLPSRYWESAASGAQHSSLAGTVDAATARVNPFGGGTEFGPRWGQDQAYRGGVAVGEFTSLVLNVTMSVGGFRGVVTAIRTLRSASGLVQLVQLTGAGGESVLGVVVNGQAVVATTEVLASLGLTAAGAANLLAGSAGAGGSAAGSGPPGTPPGYVRDAGSFVSWLRQLGLRPDTGLTAVEVDRIVCLARKYGVSIRLDPPHPGTPWDVPHLNIGKPNIHVPIPPGYSLPWLNGTRKYESTRTGSAAA